MATSRKIRLLIAGPRSLEARALEELVAQQTDIEVVGQSPEIQSIAELVQRHAPDVILFHVRGTQFALEVLDEIVPRLGDAKLLLVLPVYDDARAKLALQHGAYGLLGTAQEYPQGMRAIRTVFAGELWASRAAISALAQAAIMGPERTPRESRLLLQLTEREREVVELLRDGASNKQIASQLKISDKTVKTHLQNIFGKLQVRRRQMIFAASRAMDRTVSSG